MSKQKKPPDNEIITYYNSDLSLTIVSVANHFNVSKTVISRVLKRNNIKIRKPNYKQHMKPVSISKTTLIRLYIHQNKSAAEIARLYKCNAQTILNKLNKYNIAKDPEHIKKTQTSYHDFDWDNKEWLEEQYIHKQKALSQIALETNSTEQTVKSRLLKHGFVVRTHAEASKLAANKPSGKAIRSKISKAAKNAWKDPEYREKVMRSKKYTSKLELIIRGILDDLGIRYKKICPKGYEFDICIEPEDISQERGLLIEVNGIYWHHNNPRDEDKFLFWKEHLADRYRFETIWEYEFAAYQSIFNRLKNLLPVKYMRNL